MKRITVLALWLALGPSPRAAAQEAALPDLLAAAESRNPRIAAAIRLAEAAAARAPQAGALPDPVLGVGFMNVPVADPGLGNDMMTMAQIQVITRLPWPGKLGLSEEIAALGAEAATWEVERVRDEVAAEVKAAYYRLYFVDRALDITQRNERLLADFARLTASRYAVGTGRQPEVLKAQVERTRLNEQWVALSEERTRAAARLNALLDRPTDAPVEPAALPAWVTSASRVTERAALSFTSEALATVTPRTGGGDILPDVAELRDRALEHNPAIQAHVLRVAAREKALELSRTAKLPDISVTAGYSQRAGLGDFFDLMISAPIPIFAGRKQEQGMLEAAAVLEEHRERHRAMVNDLSAEIATLHAVLESTRGQLALLEGGVLPQARGALGAATASYRVGDVDFLTLLDTQVTLYRYELDQHRLLADFAETLASLERAVGTEVLR